MHLYKTAPALNRHMKLIVGLTKLCARRSPPYHGQFIYLFIYLSIYSLFNFDYLRYKNEYIYN